MSDEVEVTATYEKRGKINVWAVCGTIKKQIADEIDVEVANETFAPQDFVPWHVWRVADDGFLKCLLCHAVQTFGNQNAACPDAVAERAITQLNVCLKIAEELETGEVRATKGDYIWSSAYEVIRATVLSLRTENKHLINAMLKENLLAKIGDLMTQLKELREENSRLRDSSSGKTLAAEMIDLLTEIQALKDEVIRLKGP